MENNILSNIKKSTILIIILIVIIIVETILLITKTNILNNSEGEEFLNDNSTYPFLYDENNSIKSFAATCGQYQFYISGEYDILDKNGASTQHGTYYFKNDSNIELTSDNDESYVLKYIGEYIKDTDNENYNCTYGSQ